jgi:hypothetical protein
MAKAKKAVKRAKAAVRKAVEAVKQFTAWSYSRYKDHRTCPRMAHWKHILKKPQGPKSPAMQRGGDIHKEGEAYLLGKLRAVPAAYKAFRKEMEALRKAKATPEGKWGMAVSWSPVDYFDWARCWCRVVLDARVFQKIKARVIDFKTGKVYPDDNEEQMELYAIGAFEHYPKADEVDVELWYLDQARPKTADGYPNPMVKTYRRAQLPALEKKWRTKVIPILSDKRFVPNQGRHCSWCDFSRRKGGDCEF